MLHEALYYNNLRDNSVKCCLCPNFCTIGEGQISNCRSRKNVSGKLYAVNYSRYASIHVDPIEKKPLYHYYPGSKILSIGPNSCNFHCNFCQNFEISQFEQHTNNISPEDVLALLVQNNLKLVAFTYTEPFTWYEFILECGKLLTPHGIKIVLVSNGYVNDEPLLDILPYIDAMNIDLKSSRDSFYHDVCHGSIEPVLSTIRTAYKSCHIEITTLIIPGLNDSEQEIREIVDFVSCIDSNIPLHLSKYFPHWNCHQPATTSGNLIKAYEICKKKLNHVYLGNISSDTGSDTYCQVCHHVLIERYPKAYKCELIEGNLCPYCHNAVYGKFS